MVKDHTFVLSNFGTFPYSYLFHLNFLLLVPASVLHKFDEHPIDVTFFGLLCSPAPSILDAKKNQDKGNLSSAI